MVNSNDNIETLREINQGIVFYTNRKKYYETKERTFKQYNLPLLMEKAAHEVDLAKTQIHRLKRRQSRLYQLLN